MRMSKLEVPGAKLYHETYGDGPMLLCISGADGSCEIWRGFAEALKEQFKVVLWDRKSAAVICHSIIELSRNFRSGILPQPVD